MKVQFEATSAFTFLVGVVFGFSEALIQRPGLQDRSLPLFEEVPRHTRCITGPYSASDEPFGALPYFTRCTTEIYDPGFPHAGSAQWPNLARNNPYAANEAELFQWPDFARRSSMTFLTKNPTPPYFKGKPGEGQTVQNTFGFREAEMYQPGPHLLFNEFHPIQTIKEYWLPIDESEYFPPVKRGQYFLDENLASDPVIKSDHPSRRHKFVRSISYKEIPSHSLGHSLFKQNGKIRQHIPMGYVQELHSSEGNSPLSFPQYPSVSSVSSVSSEGNSPLSFPQYPSLPYFSEIEEEEEEDEEEGEDKGDEEEDPFYPQYFSPPFFPEEQGASSLHHYTSPPILPQHQEYTSPPFPPQERPVSSFYRYTSPPFFPEEQRGSSFHRYTSPSSFLQGQEHTSPQKPRASSFPQHQQYSQHARPAAFSFVEPDKTPVPKSFLFNGEREPSAGDLGPDQTHMINGRPGIDEANGVKPGSEVPSLNAEDLWTPQIRKKYYPLLSKIRKILENIFQSSGENQPKKI